MVNQGFFGAIEQYFTVEDKPRLHRRNTWFEDNHIDPVILRVLLFLGTFATIIAIVLVMLGVMV